MGKRIVQTFRPPDGRRSPIHVVPGWPHRVVGYGSCISDCRPRSHQRLRAASHHIATPMPPGGHPGPARSRLRPTGPGYRFDRCVRAVAPALTTRDARLSASSHASTPCKWPTPCERAARRASLALFSRIEEPCSVDVFPGGLRSLDGPVRARCRASRQAPGHGGLLRPHRGAGQGRAKESSFRYASPAREVDLRTVSRANGAAARLVTLCVKGGGVEFCGGDRPGRQSLFVHHLRCWAGRRRRLGRLPRFGPVFSRSRPTAGEAPAGAQRCAAGVSQGVACSAVRGGVWRVCGGRIPLAPTPWLGGGVRCAGAQPARAAWGFGSGCVCQARSTRGAVFGRSAGRRFYFEWGWGLWARGPDEGRCRRSCVVASMGAVSCSARSWFEMGGAHGQEPGAQTRAAELGWPGDARVVRRRIERDCCWVSGVQSTGLRRTIRESRRARLRAAKRRSGGTSVVALTSRLLAVGGVGGVTVFGDPTPERLLVPTGAGTSTRVR